MYLRLSSFKTAARIVSYRLAGPTEKLTRTGWDGMSRLTEPPPPLDGEIRFDGRARAAAAEDFGHLVHRSPEGVLLPASDEDVAAAVRWTAGQGRRFAAQGTRHSVFGRAQVRDGIVADLRRLRTVDHVQHDRVVADAGATWREAVATTLPQGLVPPVLTDYLDLSVAGTLVAGGVGSRTWRFGAQSDNVLDLQVVTGRGEKLTCSPNRNRRLFDTVRAGLGQVGVITRATLRLVPAPQQVRRFLLFYHDLTTMLGDQRLLVHEHRFDGVQGAAVPARKAAGCSGSRSRRSSPGTGRRTPRCSPACPTTTTPPDRTYPLAPVTVVGEPVVSAAAREFSVLRRAPELEAERRQLDRWLAAPPGKGLALVAQMDDPSAMPAGAGRSPTPARCIPR